MKKICFFAAMILSFAATSFAKSEHYYYELYALNDSAGNNSVTHYRIEFDENKFVYDSDSEDDATFQIKNLKTSGDKKTFDLYRSDTKGTTKVILRTDEKGRMILKVGSRVEYVVTDDKKAMEDYYHQKRAAKNKENQKSPEDKATDKAKSKEKNLLKKGKNLFKK